VRVVRAEPGLVQLADVFRAGQRVLGQVPGQLAQVGRADRQALLVVGLCVGLQAGQLGRLPGDQADVTQDRRGAAEPGAELGQGGLDLREPGGRVLAARPKRLLAGRVDVILEQDRLVLLEGDQALVELVVQPVDAQPAGRRGRVPQREVPLVHGPGPEHGQADGDHDDQDPHGDHGPVLVSPPGTGLAHPARRRP
jgi:hypothetical protein